jgi:phage terminase large subunit-like protein
VCWEVWKYAEAVEAGAVNDPTFLPAIYAALPDDDWKDESTWARANPNLGVSVRLDFLRSECARAVEMPTYENTFRQLYLNQWTEQDQRWLRMDYWAKGNTPCPVDLRGRDCFGGLDLATTFDTTCLALLFPLDDGTFWVEPHFWIPEENMRQRVRRDKVQYDVWHRQGHLHTTHGNVTDFDHVRADINAARGRPRRYRLWPGIWKFKFAQQTAGGTVRKRAVAAQQSGAGLASRQRRNTAGPRRQHQAKQTKEHRAYRRHGRARDGTGNRSDCQGCAGS